MTTNSLVSYGNLRPAFIGALGVVFGALLKKAENGEPPTILRPVEDVIEFSDSGIWGDEPVDQASAYRIFRVSDFRGDFQLDLKRAPLRSIPAGKGNATSTSDCCIRTKACSTIPRIDRRANHRCGPRRRGRILHFLASAHKRTGASSSGNSRKVDCGASL